jgi:hypothetical protein
VDWVIHGLIITPLQLVGSFFVIVAFCLLVFSGMIGLKKEKEDESMELMLSEEINKEKKILDSDMNHNIKSHHTI